MASITSLIFMVGALGLASASSVEMDGHGLMRRETQVSKHNGIPGIVEEEPATPKPVAKTATKDHKAPPVKTLAKTVIKTSKAKVTHATKLDVKAAKVKEAPAAKVKKATVAKVKEAPAAKVKKATV